MRTRFFKLAVLVLALLIALTGCSLIEIDQEMDMAEVVAEVGGTRITKGEVIDAYNYQRNYMLYMYNAYYGTTELTADQIAKIKDDVLESYIQTELLRQKAEELNLTDFSDESFAEADQEATDYYESLIEQYRDTAATEGMTDEEAREATIAYLEENGATLDDVKKSYREEHVAELVREHVIADVTVSDDEIQAKYDEEVADDESSYSSSSYLFEYDTTRSGEIIAWMPEGYRTVKHILFKLRDEQSEALSALNSQLSEVEDQIAALEAPADEDAAEGEDDNADENASGSAGDTVKDAEDAKDAVEDAAEDAKDAVEGAAEDVKDVVEGAAEDVKDVVEGAAEDVKDVVEGAAEDAKDAVEEAVEAISDAVEEAPKTMEELVAEKADLEQKIADLKAEVLDSFKEKTDDVYARLEAGETFDDLMAELGEDQGMMSDPAMTTGYYVSANSSRWDIAFRDAAMALEKIGDVSEPVLSASGVHIIYYNSDVTPGPVDIESLRDALADAALTDKQNSTYDTQYEEWKQAANVRKYPNKLN